MANPLGSVDFNNIDFSKDEALGLFEATMSYFRTMSDLDNPNFTERTLGQEFDNLTEYATGFLEASYHLNSPEHVQTLLNSSEFRHALTDYMEDNGLDYFTPPEGAVDIPAHHSVNYEQYTTSPESHSQLSQQLNSWVVAERVEASEQRPLNDPVFTPSNG